MRIHYDAGSSTFRFLAGRSTSSALEERSAEDPWFGLLSAVSFAPAVDFVSAALTFFLTTTPFNVFFVSLLTGAEETAFRFGWGGAGAAIGSVITGGGFNALSLAATALICLSLPSRQNERCGDSLSEILDLLSFYLLAGFLFLPLLFREGVQE